MVGGSPHIGVVLIGIGEVDGNQDIDHLLAGGEEGYHINHLECLVVAVEVGILVVFLVWVVDAVVRLVVAVVAVEVVVVVRLVVVAVVAVAVVVDVEVEVEVEVEVAAVVMVVAENKIII